MQPKSTLRIKSYVILITGDGLGRVMMVLGPDGTWGFPGGTMDPTKPSELAVALYHCVTWQARQVADLSVARREFGEETGLVRILPECLVKTRQYTLREKTSDGAWRTNLIKFYVGVLGADMDVESVEALANELRQSDEVVRIEFKPLSDILSPDPVRRPLMKADMVSIVSGSTKAKGTCRFNPELCDAIASATRTSMTSWHAHGMRVDSPPLLRSDTAVSWRR